MRNAVQPIVKLKAPQQLSLVLDVTQLKGISVDERSAVIARLARLVMEAAGVESKESADDGR
jgi:hypothetical protein